MPTTPATSTAAARALDASLDRAALTEATNRRRTIDLLTEVLETEARVAALADHAGTIRAVLLQRARAYRDEHGMAPTWRADVGSVVLSVPSAKLAVTDRAAFTAWARTAHPDQVTATVTVPVALLEALLSNEGEVTIDRTRDVAVAVDAAWERAFVKGCGLVDGSVFAPDSGDEVPGVTEVPASPPTLSVRPDAEVKARLVAEVRASTLALLAAEADAGDEAPSPLEDVTDAPIADATDDPGALVVDPAEGVVRVGMDVAAPAFVVQHGDGSVETFPVPGWDDEGADVPDHVPSRAIEDVHLPDHLEDLDAGDPSDAGAEPDYADEAPTTAPHVEDGPRWHAARLAADPRLSFHLHGSKGAALAALADQLALPDPRPAKRNDLARALLARVAELTTATPTTTGTGN